MKENGRKDPLRFGRGRQKVTVYAPTKSLPYHRIAYWLGGKRLQRSFKDGQQAREEARALSKKLADGAVSKADFTNGQAFRYKMPRIISSLWVLALMWRLLNTPKH